MMEGEAVENHPHQLSKPTRTKAAHICRFFISLSRTFFGRACAAEIRFSNHLFNIRSKPFSYALSLLFFKVGMLSLRSGWLPFYQEKGKSPSAADLYRFFIGSRGKPAQPGKRSILF
ncbi:hypothetical protein G6M24_48135 [Agrobacterium tumefaciens]|nr:hypothetical protein [Agrobacterium tumefaciens]